MGWQDGGAAGGCDEGPCEVGDEPGVGTYTLECEGAKAGERVEGWDGEGVGSGDAEVAVYAWRTYGERELRSMGRRRFGWARSALYRVERPVGESMGSSRGEYSFLLSVLVISHSLVIRESCCIL